MSYYRCPVQGYADLSFLQTKLIVIFLIISYTIRYEKKNRSQLRKNRSQILNNFHHPSISHPDIVLGALVMV